MKVHTLECSYFTKISLGKRYYNTVRYILYGTICMLAAGDFRPVPCSYNIMIFIRHLGAHDRWTTMTLGRDRNNHYYNMYCGTIRAAFAILHFDLRIRLATDIIVPR